MTDPRRTFVGRLRASWGGERDARPLEALRQAGKPTYQELMLADQLRVQLAVDGAGVWHAPPAAASQLLSAWCAVVLQSLGEVILDAAYAADPRTAGYLPPATYDQAWHWFSGADAWLSRARQAATSSGYDVTAELALPAALPIGAVAKGVPAEHRYAMLAAVAPIRQHAEVGMFHLERHAPAEAAPAVDRLRQLAGLAAAGSDYLAGLRDAHDDPRLHDLIDDRVRTVLGLWFHVGQLAAMPKLIATYQQPRPEAPAGLPRSGAPAGLPRSEAPAGLPRSEAPAGFPGAGASAGPVARAGNVVAMSGRRPPPPAGPVDGVFQGRGDKVIRRLDLPDGPCLLMIAHDGSENFAVWTLTARGEEIDLLVNHIGDYRGVRPLNFAQTPAAVKIETGGAWQVAVQPFGQAPEWTGACAGRGAAVLRVPPGAVSGLTVVRITHDGGDNFLVAAHGESWELLVNEIGGYHGEVQLPEGALALEIDADGSWTIEEV